MRSFEDWVLTAVVDEGYRPVPPGEYGAKVLVTSLFSRTLPLIRYELSDNVRVAVDDHSCGLPFAVLDSLQGRLEEAVILPATSGGRTTVRPLVFNRVMDIVAAGDGKSRSGLTVAWSCSSRAHPSPKLTRTSRSCLGSP